MRNAVAKLSFMVFIFVVIFAVFFFVYRIFAKNDTRNHVLALRDNVETLIDTKKNTTLGLAKKLALDPRLISVMRTRQYKKLYQKDFFHIGPDYGDFTNLGIHVADEKGINRYFSWTRKALGLNALRWRRDLVLFYRNPHPTRVVSVGKFDMTFKGTVPIWDQDQHFLGIVETITHFDSIAHHLEQKGIYSAVVIEKRFNKQLTYPLSPHVVDGYRISNLDLHPAVEEFLRKYGVEYFIKNDPDRYVLPDGEFFRGYYVVSVPIFGAKHSKIGHYIAFSPDKLGLALNRYILYALMVVLIMLFFYVTYLFYRKKNENEYLINNLDNEVQKKTEENIKILTIDTLTGCYRKNKFITDVHKYNGDYVVLFDIRNFSKINEMYNFKVGDEVLKITAQRVESLLVRKIYRINGDEFGFVSQNYQDDIAIIREAFLSSPILTAQRSVSLHIMFHFSVAKIVKGHHMLKELAIAMKHAKKQPYRDYIMYYPKRYNDKFIEINSLLNIALNGDEESIRIVPYFQPIIDNTSGQVARYEALARLIEGEKIYTPFDFLDVASSSGLLHKLTEKMIEKSLARFATIEDHSIGISINITEDDLLTLRLGQFLMDRCTKYSIDTRRVTLEILEGVTSHSAKENVVQLGQLRRAGFKLAIDDFGVEYSNFERLVDAEIDAIKIDGKYIKNLTINPKSRVIVRSITESAHQLGIKVVAEFVEDKEIQNLVKDFGIDYSQGYYFAKPSEDFYK